ncbi:MAG: M23 family metallopeptidase [Bacillota bacterium]|nr:M23 family metallopeptidase [Bacillota bacterium]
MDNKSKNSQKNNLSDGNFTSNRLAVFFSRYGFYALVLVCLLIVCGIFYTQRSTNNKNNIAKTTSVNTKVNTSEINRSQDERGISSSDKKVDSIDNAKEVKNNSDNPTFAKIDKNNNGDNASKPTSAAKAQTAIKPVDGKIVLAYSNGKNDGLARVFNGEYRNIVGEYISAKQGMPVVAVLDGKVQYAKDGKVIIKHDNGLKTTYSNVDSICVSENQEIKQNTKIGIIGDTDNGKNVVVDCDHLYFEVDKLDGSKYVDINPQTLVKYEITRNTY